MKERFISEHAEQCRLIAWFRATYPDVLIFAIPNGGARNIVTATKLKAEGVLPGVPDIFIPAWKLWVEMKKEKGGRVSESQKKIFPQLEKSGYSIVIGHGFRDAMEKINQFANGGKNGRARS